MSSSLATVTNGTSAISQSDFVAQMTMDRFRENYMPGARDEADVRLCFEVMRQTGLNPVLRQIYFLERTEGYGEKKKTKVTPQTSIDGYRLIAERSGKRDGELPPQWCGPDGIWHDIWARTEPPFACRVGVCKSGCSNPFYGVAHYSEYCATRFDKEARKQVPMGLWTKMPAQMLAKCSEALAIRKAFPQETAGIYTKEEMQQADNGKDYTPAASYPPSQVVQGEIMDDTPSTPPVSETKAYAALVKIAQRKFKSADAFTAWVAANASGRTPDTVTEADCKALYEMLAKELTTAAKQAETAAKATAKEEAAPATDRAAVKTAWYAALGGKLDEFTATWWAVRDYGWDSSDDTLDTTPVPQITLATKVLVSLSAEQIAEILDDYRCSLMDEEAPSE